MPMLQVPIDTGLLRAVKATAARNGISMKDFVTALLKDRVWLNAGN